MSTRLISFLAILIISSLSINFLQAQDWKRLKNLKGTWLFKIGDDPTYSKSNFDDDDWDRIHVPESWEEEGFQNYDGFAWYRKHFDFTLSDDDGLNFIKLGYIDDVDAVYLNGKMIGSTGSFPPDYETAYNIMRIYPVSKSDFNKNGENVIAVRVYDDQIQGGILSGEVGVYKKEYDIDIQYSLEGYWKLMLEDNPAFSKPEFDDAKWEKILVPSKWDDAGHYDYDGFGWYRKEFTTPKDIFTDDLILMVGKIDDIDEVYLNGKKIGSTGKMYDDESRINFDQEYSKFRGYKIPKDLLKKTGTNCIAVRVYDGYKDGGIYQGPVGLVYEDDYRNFLKRDRRKNRNNFGDFLKYIFGD